MPPPRPARQAMASCEKMHVSSTVHLKNWRRGCRGYTDVVAADLAAGNGVHSDSSHCGVLEVMNWGYKRVEVGSGRVNWQGLMGAIRSNAAMRVLKFRGPLSRSDGGL